MQQISAQLSNLPISVIFISNGQIGFHLHQHIGTIFDQGPTGEPLANLTNEKIALENGEEYLYNVAYSVTTSMRSWLTSQNMTSPI